MGKQAPKDLKPRNVSFYLSSVPPLGTLLIILVQYNLSWIGLHVTVEYGVIFIAGKNN